MHAVDGEGGGGSAAVGLLRGSGDGRSSVGGGGGKRIAGIVRVAADVGGTAGRGDAGVHANEGRRARGRRAAVLRERGGIRHGRVWSL